MTMNKSDISKAPDMLELVRTYKPAGPMKPLTLQHLEEKLSTVPSEAIMPVMPYSTEYEQLFCPEEAVSGVGVWGEEDELYIELHSDSINDVATGTDFLTVGSLLSMLHEAKPLCYIFQDSSEKEISVLSCDTEVLVETRSDTDYAIVKDIAVFVDSLDDEDNEDHVYAALIV